MSPAVEALWLAYTEAAGGDRSADFYEAFHFNDNEEGALSLGRLVVAGIKRATASLVWTYQHTGKRAPRPGDLSVVTDWHGQPLCIIETTKTAVVPFNEVSAEFAAIEGEGDGSLEYWKNVHWIYYSRVCKRMGKEPDGRMLVICEQFDVVYRAGQDQV